MRLIQIALVFGSIVLLVCYSVFLRSRLRDRALALLLFLTAIVAILFPGLTTDVANALEVGRGTDLLIYIFVLGAAFGFIALNARIMRLEDHITKLVRELALSRAGKPGEDGSVGSQGGVSQGQQNGKA